MAENSKIEWTDATFNPVIGCEKVSPGCLNCYAEVSTPVRAARGKGVELWGNGAKRQRTSVGNWNQVLRWNRKPWICESCGRADDKHYDHSCTGKSEDACHTSNVKWHRRRVFCASLSDWLDEAWPIKWLADLLELIYATPNLDWLLLTKRPQNFFARLNAAMEPLMQNGPSRFVVPIGRWIKHGGEFAPENVWIGTTVEDQKRADERIPELLKIPAKVRFLSCEPLLENIRIRDALRCDVPIHWVIAGLESGPKKRWGAGLEGLRSLRDQCAGTQAKFFCKQVDKVQPIPADLMIREFPV